MRHAPAVQLTRKEINRAVQSALREDIGRGDVTTLAVIPEAASARAAIVAREGLIVAGGALVQQTFRSLSRRVQVRQLVDEAHRAKTGARLFEVTGPARALLSGERVALNFLQRLCGIATFTGRFVQAARGTGTVILDTRKT